MKTQTLRVYTELQGEYLRRFLEAGHTPRLLFGRLGVVDWRAYTDEYQGHSGAKCTECGFGECLMCANSKTMLECTAIPKVENDEENWV